MGDEETYDCLICAEPCKEFGVFDCGHYCCGICALRIFFINKGPCPICRKASERLVITDSKLPSDEDTFDVSVFATPFKPGAGKGGDTGSLQYNKWLNCYVDGPELYDRIDKLGAYLCPVPGCWEEGQQEPFSKMKDLATHLRNEHKLKYCTICLEHRPVFLCEQIVYTDSELDNHNRAKCKKDSPIFQGHPLCLYCSKRFYDGEQLLKHMMKEHYTCDTCNSREFVFTFYKTRAKLLEHFNRDHKLCAHPECAHLDPMERVFRSDVELQAHMQRAHGVQSRNVSLASLGFNFSVAGSRSSPEPANSGPAIPNIHGGGVANGDSTHATKIIFDHVSRREEVNMQPTAKRKDGEDTSFSLPAHYERIPAKAIVRKVVPAASPSPKAAEEAASQMVVLNEGKTTGKKRGKGSSSDSPKVGGGSTPSSPTSPAAAAMPAAPKKVKEPLPTDPKLLDKILKERLAKHLNNRQFDEFRRSSIDFLNNKMLATEYYQTLQSFLADPDDLEDVFDPLVLTMPNETKREALTAAKRMLSSREAAQLEQVRREKAAKEAAALAAERKKNAWGGKKGGKGGSTTTVSLTELGTTAPSITPPPRAGASWGGNTRQGTSPPPASAAPDASFLSGPGTHHTDPEDFPTLAGNPTRPKKGGPKGGSSMQKWATAPGAAKGKTNIWFQNNSKK